MAEVSSTMPAPGNTHESPVCPRCGCVLMFPCEDHHRTPRIGDSVVVNTYRGAHPAIVIRVGEGDAVDVVVMPRAACPIPSPADLAAGEFKTINVGIAREVPYGYDAGQWVYAWEYEAEVGDD